MELYTIGVDIGGTTVATGLVNESGKVLKKVEIPSIPENREEMFQQVIKSINKLLSEIDTTTKSAIKGIGIGVPGKVDVDNGVAVFQNNLPWENFPLVKRLKEEYKNFTVVLDNDVYMATYAEHKMNNIKLDDTFVYFTISTGVSCAIIDKNEFIRGNGFAGEVGFLPSRMVEGEIQRLEKTTGGPTIANYGREITGSYNLETKDVFEDFYKGEEYAQKIIYMLAKEIAFAVYSIVCIIDPHSLIFGGSVILRNPALLTLIKEELNKLLVEEQKHILNNMNISQLDNNQGIIGAALKVFT